MYYPERITENTKAYENFALLRGYMTIPEDYNIDAVGRRRPIRNKAQFNPRGNKIEDKRFSVCICNYGIFEDTEYVWTKNGFMHTRCVKD